MSWLSHYTITSGLAPALIGGEGQPEEGGRLLPMSVFFGPISWGSSYCLGPPHFQWYDHPLHLPTHLHLGKCRDPLPSPQHLLLCPTQINTHNYFSFLFSISNSFQRLWNQSSQSLKAQSLRIRVLPDLILMKRKHTLL